MDEFARISFWTNEGQAPDLLEARGVRLAIGDDAAIVAATNKEDRNEAYDWLYTVDTMVEEIHFKSETMSLEAIGYKALASNISDIAAMGGIPMHAVVAISIPSRYSPQQIKQIYNGIYQCANQYGVAIVGGDTTSSPHSLVLTITVIGKVEAGTAIRRSGAKPGDVLFVTGIAGKSAAGLHLLLNAHQEQHLAQHHLEMLKQAHQAPQPQVAQGRLLHDLGSCHALNDVSDGLASEAAEIAAASAVDIVIDEQLLPISESLSQYSACAQQSTLEWILYGGEDYILLGSMPTEHFAKTKAAFSEQGMELYEIGRVEQGQGEVWLEALDAKLERKQRTCLSKRGYNHFI